MQRPCNAQVARKKAHTLSYGTTVCFPSIADFHTCQRDVRLGSIFILTMRRSLPVYPDKQTFSDPVGTSHLGHERTLTEQRIAPLGPNPFVAATGGKADVLRAGRHF
jgi:hypothetical protein